MSSLRKRLTRARTYMGNMPQPIHRKLESSTILQYSDKLQPLFSDEYMLKLAGHDDDSPQMKASEFLLNQALSAPILSVTNLTIQPGEKGFVTWLIISSYFPLVSACMAPISNLISLVCLIEKWGIGTYANERLDNSVILGINILSFIFGILGNMSLVLNFSERMAYLTSQMASVSCWLIAGALLLVAVIMAKVRLDELEGEVIVSEGYHFATFTVFFYFACALIQSVNFLGYTLKKYPPVFNLSRRQRSLMMFIICFTIWQAIGTIAMAFLIEDILFGNSLYFCTVSILTIGYGNIVPVTLAAKGFDLFFCFVGIILVGLIVAMIRQVVLTSAAPCIFWHRIEIARQKLIKELESESTVLSSEEAFLRMRKIRRDIRFHEANLSLLTIVITFIFFWLIGAMIFSFIEKWSYFNAVYFCFITLLTIGYGDFLPVTPLGRTVFVVWAFFAVPLMTVMISYASDTLFQWAEHLESATTRLLHWKTYFNIILGIVEKWFPNVRSNIRQESDSNLPSPKSRIAKEQNGLLSVELREEPHDVGLLAAERLRSLHSFINDDYEVLLKIMNRIDSIKKLMVDTVEQPDKIYLYDEWMEHLDALNVTNMSGEDADFWISDQSPLRLPINEPSFLLLKIFTALEFDVVKLLQSQERSLSSLRRFCYDNGINPEDFTRDNWAGPVLSPVGSYIEPAPSKVSSSIQSGESNSYQDSIALSPNSSEVSEVSEVSGESDALSPNPQDDAKTH